MSTGPSELFETFLIAVTCIAIGIGLGWQLKRCPRCVTGGEDKDPDDWWKRGDPPPFGAP
jgi:hypothetical protein